MLAKTLVLLATAALAAAGPHRRRTTNCKPQSIPPAPSATSLPAAPALPASTLPAPDAGLVLKAIGLGHGVQNYSCDASGSSPVSKGALAVLYDVTKLYPSQSFRSLSLNSFEALTSVVVHGSELPINLTSTVNRMIASDLGADPNYPFNSPALPLSVPNVQGPVDILGHHFFDTSGNPTFVTSVGSITSAKNATAAAPSTADVGPAGTGAVSWLKLDLLAGATANGILNVFRVDTAGGDGHNCTAAGLDTVAYTALYYFYGPSS